MSQAVQQLRLELLLRTVFQSPTVAEMPAIITTHRNKSLGAKNLERLLADWSRFQTTKQSGLGAKRSTTVDK
jgi:hypothetical protein